MSQETITMSHKEVDRLEVIQQIASKRLSQKAAARRLELSVRQVKRLLRRYRQEGANGLISQHRGKRANNAIPDSARAAIMSLVGEHYSDFGPTLAAEKLLERHSHKISTETLRQWMIIAGLWQPKTHKRVTIHQSRPRRPCFGELVQIDGSPHDWFEGRGPNCTLIVFIDDATGELLALHFSPTETTRAYMEALAIYLQQQGRPVALYSDKHSIFRVNYPQHEGELTQFTRALKTLDIQPIHANTPQAKGRVERANQTLQDRLVKELRLQDISDIESANTFLPTFMADYNQRFAVVPQSPVNAHREVLHGEDELALIFTLHYTRRLSKNLTCQFKNREYQVQSKGGGYHLRHTSVTVCEAFDGSVTLLHKGRNLSFKLLCEGELPTPIADEKSVRNIVERAKADQMQKPQYKPPLDHPWKRRSYIMATEQKHAQKGDILALQKRGHF